MSLLVQLAGSALILIAFIAAQRERLTPASRSYLTLNALGSLALAVSALIEAQWGFLVLETVWCWFSIAGLRRSLLAG
jgi:hypothetical protein